MIARLEASKDITCVLEKLEALAYDVTPKDKKTAYVYRKNSNSTKLRGDVKSAKDACKYVGTISVLYGTNTSSM